MMEVLCTGIACGNTECQHAESHEPIENGDGDCRDTTYCGTYGGMVRCGEVVKEHAKAEKLLELQPA